MNAPPKRKKWALPLAALLVIGGFLGLLAWFARPAVVFSKQPVATGDYALHAYQVDRALNAFRGWGKLWAYDPLLLAGQPAGVVEDLTSKGTELFVIALAKLGVSAGFAFNLFILLVHLGMPAAGWASARMFRLSQTESLVVVALWISMWFFDSLLHWCWWVGMISWSADCYLAVLYIALLHGALEDRKPWQFGLLALLGAVLTLIHPFGALGVMVPALAMYARAFRGMRAVDHALLGAAVLAAGSTVLVWIGPVLRFRHYIGDADTFFRPGIESVLLDYFDLIKDWLDTGVPMRTMLRMLGFVAGAIALLRWRKLGDSRFLPLAATLLWTIGFSYLAGYSWHGRQTQPYRQIGIATLASAIPAAVLLTEILAPSTLRALSRPARVLLVLALVLIVPRFGRNVLVYFPEALPERVVRNEYDKLASQFVGLSPEPRPYPMRHERAPEEAQALRAWLLRNHGGRGRVLLVNWVVAEYLAAASPLPILGGLKERNVPQMDAQPLRQDPEAMRKPNALATYFERYAVGWIVVDGEFGPLDVRNDLLVPVEKVAGFRIYRTRAEPSYTAVGKADVVAQGLNSIKVRDAAGPEVVLRFHWFETLRCRPDCQIERASVPNNRVGFIRVPNPPSAFEIYNGY